MRNPERFATLGLRAERTSRSVRMTSTLNESPEMSTQNEDITQEVRRFGVDWDTCYVSQYDSRTVVVYNRKTKTAVAEHKVPHYVDCRDWSW